MDDRMRARPSLIAQDHLFSLQAGLNSCTELRTELFGIAPASLCESVWSDVLGEA